MTFYFDPCNIILCVQILVKFCVSRTYSGKIQEHDVFRSIVFFVIRHSYVTLGKFSLKVNLSALEKFSGFWINIIYSLSPKNRIRTTWMITSFATKNYSKLNSVHPTERGAKWKYLKFFLVRKDFSEYLFLQRRVLGLHGWYPLQ